MEYRNLCTPTAIGSRTIGLTKLRVAGWMRSVHTANLATSTEKEEALSKALIVIATALNPNPKPLTARALIHGVAASRSDCTAMADLEAPQVVLHTTMGDITIELYVKHAPKTCRNFLELSRRAYYNNVLFHRVIKNFMVQGGDPTGTGRGGESIYGSKFEDEIKRDLKHTGAGILSMANSGPNTNGSQFFITLGPTPWLDSKHTIFGRVCKGMDVVKRLGMVETDKHDRPTHEVKILKTSVVD